MKNNNTSEWIKSFNEKFPETQKESTHFDDCNCWSCNNYRSEVKSFISQLLQKEREEIQEGIEKYCIEQGYPSIGVNGYFDSLTSKQ